MGKAAGGKAKKVTRAVKKQGAKRPAAKKAAPKQSAAERAMIEVENVNHPGKTSRVDAQKYAIARAAMLNFLPKHGPGLTQSEMTAAMRAALPRADFPGTTSSWWMKSVQLDLEAKRLVVRDGGKPLRWRRV
ncbi:MAG: hypothetical protein AB7P07_11230 [Hyphomonadaceae bacterium]